MTEQQLLVSLAVTLRILVTAAVILVCAWYILRVRPLPSVRALLIAAGAHLIAKGADLLGVPLSVVLLIPGLVHLVLSYFAFRPTIARLLVYWVADFVIYMVIHVLLSVLFDLNFLFGVWIPASGS